MQSIWQFPMLFQDYYKALEDADEKVQLANQIYDLVSRDSRSGLQYPTSGVAGPAWRSFDLSNQFPL